MGGGLGREREGSEVKPRAMLGKGKRRAARDRPPRLKRRGMGPQRPAPPPGERGPGDRGGARRLVPPL